MDVKELIGPVAGKLSCHDLTTQNYTKDAAMEILSNCVAAKMCIQCLIENEQEVISLLPHQLFAE